MAQPPRKIGLWMIGALGGVSSTVALGLSNLAHGLGNPTGMVTALPAFDGLDLDALPTFIVGGHDIRAGTLLDAIEELGQRSSIFHPAQVAAAKDDLTAWSHNIRPGCVVSANATITAMADARRIQPAQDGRHAIQLIQTDLREFQERHQLDQVVVVNVASTEPPFELTAAHQSLGELNKILGQVTPPALPASALYAYAALDLGIAYVNFTPSLGASVPALEELARERKTVIAGKDGKTGETLLKTVLAPMFAQRNLKVLSWVGHNIFGNRDGQVLNDPVNKASKVKTKDAVLQSIVGYKPQTLVSIEYIESLDDWKTAWDHIHFEGFLGVKMILQFTWQGCDSILAAPLVINLARLALLSQRRGESGVLQHLACFFKSPMGVSEHDFHRQSEMLRDYVAAILAM